MICAGEDNAEVVAVRGKVAELESAVFGASGGQFSSGACQLNRGTGDWLPGRVLEHTLPCVSDELLSRETGTGQKDEKNQEEACRHPGNYMHLYMRLGVAGDIRAPRNGEENQTPAAETATRDAKVTVRIRAGPARPVAYSQLDSRCGFLSASHICGPFFWQSGACDGEFRIGKPWK